MTEFDLEYLEKLAARARTPEALDGEKHPFVYLPDDPRFTLMKSMT